MSCSPLRGIALSLTIIVSASSARAETARVWSQRGPALVEPSSPKRSFGDAVAISGTTIVVTSSASDAGTIPGGAAYLYERAGSDWLAAGPPLTLSDGIKWAAFGSPCALSKDYLIAGAVYAASAYAFTRNGPTWGVGERLIGAGSPERDWFVTSASISGDTAIVGVPLQNTSQTMGPLPYKPPGAYVFLREGASWLPQAKLTVDLPPGDSRLGSAVSISGETAVVTAPVIGQAYVFERTGSSWSQSAVLSRPAEATQTSFGRTAVLSADRLLLGAQRLDSADLIAGVVYEFVRSNGVWVQSLSAIAPAVTDQDFGGGLSVSGDTAIIASRRAAYLFTRTANAWEQLGEVTLATAPPYPYPSVAVDGQYAVVGVPGKSDWELGAAYIFSDACITDAECGSTALCAAGTCRARCLRDSDCDSGRFCAADGVCRGPVAVGQACDDAAPGGGCKESGCAICSTGDCVDALCCDSVCEGICGTCAPITGGQPCTADSDCDSAIGYCLDGTCAESKPIGRACKAPSECASKFCTDGVCCDSACDGPCESCADLGSEGQCVPEPQDDCSAAGAPAAGAGGTIANAGATTGPGLEANAGATTGPGLEADAGDGGRDGTVQTGTDRSATACGCRVAGGPSGRTQNHLLLLIGLGVGLAGARNAARRKARSCASKLEKCNV